MAKYLGLVGAAGLDWQATAELDEGALERRLLGRSAAETRLIQADFARIGKLQMSVEPDGILVLEMLRFHVQLASWANAFLSTLSSNVKSRVRHWYMEDIAVALALAVADGSHSLQVHAREFEMKCFVK